MNRTSLINHLISKFAYESYLEIGVRDGRNYCAIACEEKTGVDPDVSAYHDESTLLMASDEYFSSIDKEKRFDIIFIDGLHLEYQVDKDIENSLNHLSDNGTIVIHDCSPETIHHARENYRDRTTPAGAAWNGTVWRSFVKARHAKDELFTCVVDIDCGCGIIRKDQSLKKFDELSLEDCLNWETFNANRVKVCNLVTEEEFLKLFG